jgi:hypothetical protein
MSDDQTTAGITYTDTHEQYWFQNGAVRSVSAMTEAEADRRRAPTRKVLFEEALNDARNAVAAMEKGDWLGADILLKLAIDTLADTGVIP